MGKIRCLSLFCLFLLSSVAQAAPVPTLQGRVNDYAHVISADYQNRLKEFLAKQEQETSNQIVVLTINSLGTDDTIETFATKVFNAWRLGQAEKNNGVLIVASIKD